MWVDLALFKTAWTDMKYGVFGSMLLTKDTRFNGLFTNINYWIIVGYNDDILMSIIESLDPSIM